MQLGKLIDPTFQTALRKVSTQEIPLRAAFKLKGIIGNVTNELKKYDEVRNEALKQLGDKNEDGSVKADATGNVSLSADNLKTFSAQINDLLTTDVTIGTVTLTELGEKVTLSTQDLLSLDGVVTE